MNWGKVLGLVGALAFVFAFFNTFHIIVKDSLHQFNQLKNLGNLNITIVSFTESYLVVNVKNPLNVAVTICNVSGDYLVFHGPVTIPPLGDRNVTIVVTNYSGLLNKVRSNSEIISVKLRIENTTITSVNVI